MMTREAPAAEGRAEEEPYQLHIDHAPAVDGTAPSTACCPAQRIGCRAAAVGVVGLLALLACFHLSALHACLLPPALDRLALNSPVVQVAHVTIIRHAEKHDGTGLSIDGLNRARYLARCMNTGHPTVALPLGRPTYIMASHGHPGKSTRPQDTATPIAASLGLKLDSDFFFKDAEGFVKRVWQQLHHGATILVAWHHGEIHDLLRALLDKTSDVTAETLGL